MRRSIRWRLTAWYAAVVLATLLAFGIGVERYFTRTLESNRDAALRHVLDVLAGSLQHEILEHGGRVEGERSFAEVAPIHARTFRDYAWRLQRGTVLIGEAGAPARPPAVSRTGEYRFSDGPAGARSASTQIATAGALYSLSATDFQPEWEAAAQLLRRTLLLAIPLVVLLSAIGGYALAVRSFRPVVAMAATARDLEAHDLRGRLPVVNASDELGTLASTLNHLLDRIATVLKSQREFMADAAHDLRTPITIARTAAQTTLERPSDRGDAEREALRLIDRQLARVSQMVSDLLFLARSEAGEISLRRQAYYLDELMGDAVASARVLGEPKAIVWQVQAIPDTAGTGDPDLLHRMLLILLDNAIQHSPPGGTVSVELSLDGEEKAVVRVSDRGPGIPPEEQARIFDRYYRGRQGGTGLGLAIARRIAMAHGGALSLESAAPTVFRVELTRSL